MNWPPLRVALRQLHAVYADRRALLVIGLVGVLLGVVGPFGTFGVLDPGPRLLYWLAVAYATYAAGLFGGALLSAWVVREKRPLWAHIVVMGLGAAGPVTLMVLLLNRLVLAPLGVPGLDWPALLGYCLAVSLALVTLTETVVVPLLRPASSPERQPPPLLDRLPPNLRAPLSHLSMADHYVEVHTQKGRALVLMRLADAIGETRGIEGVRIHRSHWVALEAVEALRREDGRWVVALRDGTRLPVSRGYLAAARAVLERR